MNAKVSNPPPPGSKLYRRIIFTIAIFILIIIIFRNIFVILQPTERGIVFRKLTSGLDIENVRTEGLNLMAPWNDMIIFDVSEQQIEETMDVLSVDGLSINLDVSIRFRPKEKEIGLLYKNFRQNYIENLVRPELRSEVRKIIGQYTPEQLYATKRQEIENAILSSTEIRLDSNHVQLTALLFRSVKLPASIQKSIEEKLTADQESQKREYLQQIAEKDAQIQITQAKGKAESNRILSASLTDKILQEKGISATEALVNSPNAKIIIIGSGESGLPIILGN
ncbi:MAG: prohibitin family protein [Bacteroidales bacterium]|nr:prohibitin family protein [Bacteroidales bacterium]